MLRAAAECAAAEQERAAAERAAAQELEQAGAGPSDAGVRGSFARQQAAVHGATQWSSSVGIVRREWRGGAMFAVSLVPAAGGHVWVFGNLGLPPGSDGPPAAVHQYLQHKGYQFHDANYKTAASLRLARPWAHKT